LLPPPNFKVVLSVDKSTENLVLKVLRRDPVVYRFMGKIFWRTVPSWDTLECEQRRIIARTYESLLQQLQDRPEFLEFEMSVEGSLQYETAWGS
jgi:hypothetical protein